MMISSFKLRLRCRMPVALLACALLALGACAQVDKPAPTAPSTPSDSHAAPRLDVPLTDANSVMFHFTGGAVLRLPKMLFPPSVLPKDPGQPLKAQAIDMTFLYPDMTLTGWKSHMSVIFEKQAKKYVPQKDRFPVRITWMFYTPGNVRNTNDWGDYGFEPGPHKIRTNLRMSVAEVQNFTTPYRGLVQIGNIQGIKESKPPGWKPSPEKEGGTFVEEAGRPYEIYMNCDAPSSIQCLAQVYSKKHGFQYRLIFPPEAVAHTDGVILSIEKLLDQWSQK